MTNSNRTRSILSVSAFTAAVVFSILAQSGQASAAKGVKYCEGGSKRSVVECCETLVKKNGTPIWMRQTGKNCATAVKCYRPTFAAGGKQRCKIAILKVRDGGGNKNPGGRGRGTPGAAGNPNGGVN
jgi:hypothetical protein